MKISEQYFIWCRCDASLEDAQELINFFTPYCEGYFFGHHPKGKTETKPPHFHFFLINLNISMNNLRGKYKEKFTGHIYLNSKFNLCDLNQNKILSPAYILAKPYKVQHWTNLDLDWESIEIKVEQIKNKEVNNNKKTVKQSVNEWLKKVKKSMPELEMESIKADTYFARKRIFKKIFSYIMVEKVKNEEYINRNSHNELVYNIYLRLTSLETVKKIANDQADVVFERYFGEAPPCISVDSDQGFGFELEEY